MIESISCLWKYRQVASVVPWTEEAPPTYSLSHWLNLGIGRKKLEITIVESGGKKSLLLIFLCIPWCLSNFLHWTRITSVIICMHLCHEECRFLDSKTWRRLIYLSFYPFHQLLQFVLFWHSFQKNWIHFIKVVEKKFTERHYSSQ